MEQLGWEDSYVQSELKKHVAMVTPGAVGVLTTPSDRQRYAAALAPFTDAEVRVFEAPDAVDSTGLGVMVVVAHGQWATLSLTAKFRSQYPADLPIVSCSCERRFTAAPGVPAGIGVDYNGMFWLASNYINTVGRGGSYLEFGVFDGNTMTRAYHALHNVCDAFYAFDSFQGIGGALRSEKTHFVDGQYAASVETFRYNLRLNNVDEARVRIVPGFFQESLPNRKPSDFGITTASIVHIDTDVYEPARLALEFVSPALPQGALLMFDDYDQLAASNDKGERRAVKDWLAAHPEFEIEPYRAYGAFCRSFLVHRVA
jgi:O-methyltransferase